MEKKCNILNLEISKEQKDSIKRIETEASFIQTDFFREKGFGNYIETPERENGPRSVIFPFGYFLPEDVREHGARIYRKHLILEMKKTGFDNEQIIEYVKIQTNRTSYEAECKKLLGD